MPSTATSMLAGLSTSVAVKAPCRTVAASNITLSGLQTVGGVVLVADDRVLVAGQTDASENGIYMASSGAWTRAPDADGARDLVRGTLVLVESLGSGIGYELTSANPIAIGTTSLTWEQRDLTDSLRGDLAADGGSALVTFKDSVSDSEAITLSAYLNLKVKGLKATFGATGDGVANDADALNNALTTTGKIIEIEEGTFLHNSNLSVPTCAEIIGYGQDVSIIKPGAAVTKVLSLGDANAPRRLANFMIDGVSTSGAQGMVLGDASAWAGKIDQVWVRRFTGGSAYGVVFRDLLKTDISMLTCRENRVGIFVNQVNVVFPTTTTITNAVLSDNVEQGLLVRNGSGICWITLLSESNGKEGVLLLPLTNGVIEHEFINLWMEDNWTDDAAAPATRETKFSFVAGDGTALGTAKIRANLIIPQFQGGTGFPRGALFDGSAVCGEVFKPRFTSILGGDIAFRNGAYGDVSVNSGSYDITSILEDTGNLVANNEGQSKDFVPSYSSNVGNAATTFTGPGTVTTTTCRFRRMGKRTWLTLNANFTLNAVTPTEIYVTLPSGITIAYDQYFFATLTIGGTQQSGRCIVANSNDRLVIQKADGSAFASGAACTIGLTLEFENV